MNPLLWIEQPDGEALNAVSLTEGKVRPKRPVCVLTQCSGGPGFLKICARKPAVCPVLITGWIF